ncbi:hypothetical protein ACFQ0T_40690 [Kitasatospora gansuensis]
MIRGIRPLLRGSTYSGVLFAYCGAMASLPLLPFAMLPLVASRSAPFWVQAVLCLLAWAAAVGVFGLARTTRRVLVGSARRMLKVPLPDPVAGRRPAGADRWRTPLWLVLHVALGWTGALVSGLLFAMAVSLPGVGPVRMRGCSCSPGRWTGRAAGAGRWQSPACCWRWWCACR